MVDQVSRPTPWVPSTHSSGTWTLQVGGRVGFLGPLILEALHAST